MPRNTDGRLYSDSIGSYKLGAFYSSSFSGERLETELASLHGVGRKGERTQIKYIHGGVNKTLRLVILLHEASHFVHDLSLGTCLNRHYLLDQSSAIQKEFLRDVSKNDLVSCPLYPLDHANVNYSKKYKKNSLN